MPVGRRYIGRAASADGFWTLEPVAIRLFCYYIKWPMKTTYARIKRDLTLQTRALDFDDAPEVFAGPVLEIEDNRRDYGEVRVQSIGHLQGRMVMVVWTLRGDARHIISMRHCNERERKNYGRHFQAIR